MKELTARISESNFVWGFREIAFYYNSWRKLLAFPSGILPNGEECVYIKQLSHDFFTGMTLMVGRDSGQEIWFEKFF